MQSWSSEFKVGLFVLAAAALVVLSYLWSFDGVRADEEAYRIHMTIASADGLYAGSPVKIAGVEIGSTESIEIAGDRARLTLLVRNDYELPVDTQGQLKASGLLGDYFVRLFPGQDEALLADGDTITVRAEPGDIDAITRNVEDISDDIAAITEVLRQLVENEKNQEHVEATLENVDALTAEIRLIAEQNRSDIHAIVESVRRLTESLEGYTDEVAADLDDELERLKELTDHLDDAAVDIGSITGKIDRGEGTLGALVNDDETIDSLNDTLEQANLAVRSFTGLRPEVYYTGRYYLGSQPNDLETFYYGNPLHNTVGNTVGIRLRAHEDFWYVFEINDYPNGVISQTDVLREETGTVESRWTKEAKFRFTFQLEKRWGHFSFRLGVKENGGGLGATAYVLDDKLQFQLDAFDFYFGSYPAIQDAGIPNVRLLARYEPFKNVYVEAGTEQVILGAKYGYGTGFIGAGFRFTDDDIKLLLATLPLNF